MGTTISNATAVSWVAKAIAVESGERSSGGSATVGTRLATTGPTQSIRGFVECQPTGNAMLSQTVYVASVSRANDFDSAGQVFNTVSRTPVLGVQSRSN